MKANYLAALGAGKVFCNGLCVYMLITFGGFWFVVFGFFFSEKIGHLLSAALFKTRIKSQNLQRVAVDVKGLKQGFERYVLQ